MREKNHGRNCGALVRLVTRMQVADFSDRQPAQYSQSSNLFDMGYVETLRNRLGVRRLHAVGRRVLSVAGL